MKKIFFTLIIITVLGRINAQSVYDNAVALQDSIIEKKTFSVGSISILNEYFRLLNDTDLKTIDSFEVTDFNNRIDKNPFLKGFSISNSDFQSDDEKEIIIEKKASKLFSSISSFNVSTIADGTAKFLIERANQELTIAYFKRFKEQFESDTKLGKLFPITAEYVNQFEPLEYTIMLNSIKQAFIKDLEELPNNIPKLEGLDSDTFNSDEARLLLAGLEVIQPIKQGNDIAEILNILAESEYLTEPDKDNNPKVNLSIVQNSIKLLNVFSQSFLATDETKIWVSYTDIKVMLDAKDSVLLHIYLGLIYEEIKNQNIKFNDSEVAELLGNYAENTESLKKIITELSVELQNLNTIAQSIKKINEKGEKISIEQFYEYSSEVIELLSVIESFKLLEPNQWPSDQISQLLFYSKISASIVNNIKSKNYSALVVDVSIVLDSADVIKRNESKFLKYGVFIASIAEAENSDQVKTAIEAAVLPVGSYITKREAKYTISLNSYAGLSLSNQSYVIDSVASDSASKFASISNSDFLDLNTFGLNGTIGLEFSAGIDKDCFLIRKVGSIGLFIPVVDLGSLLNFRIDEKNGRLDVPPITLDNILVLGGYGVIGFKNSPLSLGIGIQNGPQLREVALEGEEALPVLAERDWGFGVFLSVDIPLFNLKVTPK